MSIAALHHDGSTDIDALLAQVAETQRAAGRRVRGLLMEYPDGAINCGAMDLVDIAQGERFRVSQELGPASTGCRVDPRGFAQASMVLRRALAETPPPDLVIINRFGNLEAEGGGLADDLLALAAAGVPVLTAVADKHAAAWERFSGGLERLPVAALPDWLDALDAPA